MELDTHANIYTHIRRADGLKEVEVRWPTDAEWAERARGWHIISTQLGRGQTESQVESAKADLALYRKIRTEESPEDLEPEEAEAIIGLLTKIDITDVRLGLDEATVEMRVANGVTVQHTLRIPTTTEVIRWRRAAARGVSLPNNRQRLYTNPQAGAELWQNCKGIATGYTNGIPLLHRDSALRAVVDKAERDAEAPADEDF